MSGQIGEGYAHIKDAAGRTFAVVFACSACGRKLIWSFEMWKCPCGNDSFRIDTAVEISVPDRRAKSKKQKIEDELRQSDLTAQLAQRNDIEYGHHESLPRGEHVARLRATKLDAQERNEVDG